VESVPQAYRLKASNAASPISTFSGTSPFPVFLYAVIIDLPVRGHRLEPCQCDYTPVCAEVVIVAGLITAYSAVERNKIARAHKTLTGFLEFRPALLCCAEAIAIRCIAAEHGRDSSNITVAHCKHSVRFLYRFWWIIHLRADHSRIGSEVDQSCSRGLFTVVFSASISVYPDVKDFSLTFVLYSDRPATLPDGDHVS